MGTRAASRALDVVGERWALLIVRELVLGPKRFTDLRAALGASPNVPSQRLGELESAGVVQRRSLGGALYELTDWGQELHPILLQLGRRGAGTQHRPVAELGVDALLLFVPQNAAGLRASYELRLGEERFAIEVASESIALQRGSARKPDTIIETDPATLRALVFGAQKLAGAAVELRGDLRLARSVFRLFARP